MCRPTVIDKIVLAKLVYSIRTHARMHPRTYNYTSTHELMHAHALALRHMYVRKRTCTRTHLHTCIYTPTYRPIQHTHTKSYTHLYERVFVNVSCLCLIIKAWLIIHNHKY